MRETYVNGTTRRTPYLSISRTIAFFLGMSAATIGVNVAGTYVVSAGFMLGAFMAAASKYGIVDLKQQWRPADSLAVLFLTWISVMELYNAAALRHAPNFGTIALWVISYLGSWPARLAVANELGFKRFALTFASPAFLVALIGTAQMLRLPGVNELLLQIVRTSGLEQRLSIGREIRATSLIGHHIGLGAYLCAVMSLLGGAMILAKKRRSGTSKASALWVAAFIGQLGTVTFATSLIAIAVSTAIAIKIKVRPRTVAAACAALVIGWGFFGDLVSQRLDQQTSGPTPSSLTVTWLPETIGFRIIKWVEETIPAAMHRPLTGWGYGVYEAADNAWPFAPYEIQWMSPESEWFRTLICGGGFALLLEVLMLIAVYRCTFTVRPKSDYLLPLKVFFLGLVAASFIHSHLTGPGVIVALWSVVGAAWGSSRRRPYPIIQRQS